VLDATYTGSKGTHLASDRVNVMQIDPKYAYLGSLLNKPIDDPAVVALGFQPPFANFKQLLGNNATLGQSLRRFPQYTGVASGGMQNHSGNSTYNAVILKATKRFSNGLSLLTSYAWSKLLTDADSAEPWIAGVVGSGRGAGAAQNQYNRGPEKAYGVLDLPNMFKLTGSYDLPAGTGKRYFATGVPGYLLGNWNLSSFVEYQSGFPLGVVDTAFQNYLFAGIPRPNVTTNDWAAPTKGDRFDPAVDNFFNASAFQRRTNPAVDSFGNAPRLDGATRSFPVFRTNIAVTKGLQVRENVNQKTWGVPQEDLANSQFGVITSASGNRSMQLSLRVVF